MQSHRPRRSPHRPPPIPTHHARSPSASSASSTSSHQSNPPRTVNSGFTVFPNSSTSTIKLVPPPSTSPAPKTPTAARHQPHTAHSSPNVGYNRPGYFEPCLMPSQQPQQSQQPTSQVAAAYAMQASQRKRSATEPSPTSPPLTGGMLSSAAGAAANAVFSRPAPDPSTIGQAISHPPPPTPPPPPPPPPPSAPPTTKKESSSKMKIFSKPTRIGTPGIEKALRPPPSPSRLDDSALRKPSFSSETTGIGYSESPPHSFHKPHFLRPHRRDKDHTFSSSNSNSKTISDGASLYSFGPSSPSSSVFAKSEQVLQKSISAIDITPKSVHRAHPKNSYEDTSLLLLSASDDAWGALRSKILPLFDGDPLRTTVEDLNKLVGIHIRRCVDRRNPVMLLDDVRELLEMGMRSIDPHLDSYADDGLVQRLVEIWNLVFGHTTPYLEAVFLPLQQEFKGVGQLTAREAREFFGVEVAPLEASPMGLDVRRLVMIAFRDALVLPLHGRLRVVFSRLRMDFSVSQREATEVVGRMLQCMSVLGGVLTGDEKQEMVEELAATLKHNWLSRGRTGRNRMGFVGTKMAYGKA